MVELPAEHGPYLRHLTRSAQPIEAGGERLLERRRDRLRSALQEEARHFLDKQRHASGPIGDALHHFPRQRVPLRDRAHHSDDFGAIERNQRQTRVVRAGLPWGAELRTAGHDDK